MIPLDEMKLETHWFLKKISAFASQSRTSVDDQLLKMFLDAAQKIADCVDRSDGTTPTKQTNVLFDIDESCYRFHRSILCTLCDVHIQMRAEDYFDHINSPMHRRSLNLIMNDVQTSAQTQRPDDSLWQVFSQTASLMTQPFGNEMAAQPTANHFPTEEYFHLPNPTTVSNVPSVTWTSNFPAGLSRSMSNLSMQPTQPKMQVKPKASYSQVAAIQAPPAKPKAALVNGSAKVQRFEEIPKAIKTLFPKAKVHMYGSHTYGLASPRSDVNVYIDIDGKSSRLQRTKAIMSDRQRMVEKALKQDREHWKNVTCGQRLVLYPLVRATNIQFGVNCTLSFGTSLFVQANYLINDFLTALPIAKAMVQFLMNWQHKIQQSDPPENVFKFSTYQMAILVICYFQLWKYLPSVKFLQSKTERVFCGDARIDYRKPIQALKPASNHLHTYLLDFFDFFAVRFNSRKDVLSAYYGKLLKRKCSSNDDSDNQELCKYIENANHTLWNEPHAYLYVHDLYIQSASPNVCADITEKSMKTFRAHCEVSAESLRQTQSNGE